MNQPDMFPEHQPIIKRRKSEKQKYDELMKKKFQENMFNQPVLSEVEKKMPGLTGSKFFKDHFVIMGVK